MPNVKQSSLWLAAHVKKLARSIVMNWAPRVEMTLLRNILMSSKVVVFVSMSSR